MNENGTHFLILNFSSSIYSKSNSPEYLKKTNFTLHNLKGNARCISKVISTSSAEVIKIYDFYALH